LDKVNLEVARHFPESLCRARFACPAYDVDTIAYHENDISCPFNIRSENIKTVIVTYVDDSPYKCHNYYPERLKVLL